jgi:hypothetical protein
MARAYYLAMEEGAKKVMLNHLQATALAYEDRKMVEKETELGEQYIKERGEPRPRATSSRQAKTKSGKRKPRKRRTKRLPGKPRLKHYEAGTLIKRKLRKSS